MAAYTNCESVSRIGDKNPSYCFQVFTCSLGYKQHVLEKTTESSWLSLICEMEQIKEALLNTLPQFSGRLEIGLKNVQDFGRWY